MSSEKKRHGLTFDQVETAWRDPSRREEVVKTVYAPYLEQLRGLLDQFPRPMRRNLKQLIADFDAGRISRHFRFTEKEAVAKTGGAKLLVEMVRGFQNDMENENL